MWNDAIISILLLYKLAPNYINSVGLQECPVNNFLLCTMIGLKYFYLIK